MLPIESVIPGLREALRQHRSAVLHAPPGAGKTTLVPLALLDEPWLNGRSIVMLEPRRLAARAAAGRMADMVNEPVGETVGYRIRFDAKVSGTTRIEVVTEGLLTRRLQSDPGLEGVGLVIFDEFHERHVHTDLALALCLESRRVLREDLRILVMSATLDGAAVAALLGDAPVIESKGRRFPVQVRYAATDVRERVPEAAAQVVLRALEREPGDALVFLPGAREIRRAQGLLSDALSGQPIDVWPLYGDLPWEAQHQAIGPSRQGRRKVVLATPIAETSLTIEGIGIVVDAGLVRVPEFDPGSGLTGLATRRLSRASAEQRAGRAGRLGPGVCERLWTEVTQRGLAERAVPEIKIADLAPLALELAAWGVRDPQSLSWLDPPPHGALARARDVLARLGALDADGAITPSGRAMAGLPVHPRLARMIHLADRQGLGRAACDLAALISERDVFVGGERRSCDVLERVEVLSNFRARGREGARAAGADPTACQRVDQASRQFQRVLGARAADRHARNDDIGVLCALAYPDRIARQRGPGDVRYLLASGRGARLPAWEHRLRPAWLVAAHLDAGQTEGAIHLAAALEIDRLRGSMPDAFTAHDVIEWDGAQSRVVARREERVGELVIDRATLADPNPDAVRAAMLDGIRRLGLDALPWTTEQREWQARVMSLRAWLPEQGWPDVSDAALMATLDDWLGPILDRATRREHLDRIDLRAGLESHLDWKQRQQLDVAGPTHLTVPSGSRIRLTYRPGESPVLAVKLQEMFGLADTPRVAGGRVPVTLHLLSPARRPIQVTQDLRGFWDRTYPDVKKELRARYPKHPWPDDPWNAVPTARTKRPTRTR